MQTSDIISLIANVGFPVVLCLVLIRYVLETIGEKLDKLDRSLAQLVESINNWQRQSD